MAIQDHRTLQAGGYGRIIDSDGKVDVLFTFLTPPILCSSLDHQNYANTHVRLIRRISSVLSLYTTYYLKW